MKSLAVTGGIGSGKSTVTRILSEKPGVRLANADDEAKRLMVEDPELRASLLARFGKETYLKDGSLNRAGLAERVFDDAEEVAALNALVHPVVLAALVQSIDQARADGVSLFVYEAALLTEIGIGDVVDAVLLVDAPLEIRIERVMARNDASREDVLERVRHQLPPENLRPIADFVIENDRGLGELRQDVDAVFTALMNSNSTTR